MAFIMAIPDMLSEFLLGKDMLGILLGGRYFMVDAACDDLIYGGSNSSNICVFP